MTQLAKSAAGDTPGPAQSLPELCSEAADHVAHARALLHDTSYDADRALAHLDDAIACLRRLVAKGRPGAAGTSTAERHSA